MSDIDIAAKAPSVSLCRPVWRDTAPNRVNTSPAKARAVWGGFRPALRKSADGTKISR